MTTFAERIAREVTMTVELLARTEAELLANGGTAPQSLDLIAQRLTDIATALDRCRITPPPDLAQVLRLESMRSALTGSARTTANPVEIF